MLVNMHAIDHATSLAALYSLNISLSSHHWCTWGSVNFLLLLCALIREKKPLMEIEPVRQLTRHVTLKGCGHELFLKWHWHSLACITLKRPAVSFRGSDLQQAAFYQSVFVICYPINHCCKQHLQNVRRDCLKIEFDFWRCICATASICNNGTRFIWWINHSIQLFF